MPRITLYWTTDGRAKKSATIARQARCRSWYGRTWRWDRDALWEMREFVFERGRFNMTRDGLIYLVSVTLSDNDAVEMKLRFEGVEFD